MSPHPRSQTFDVIVRISIGAGMTSSYIHILVPLDGQEQYRNGNHNDFLIYAYSETTNDKYIG